MSETRVDYIQLHRGVEGLDYLQCMACGGAGGTMSELLEVGNSRFSPLHDCVGNGQPVPVCLGLQRLGVDVVQYGCYSRDHGIDPVLLSL